MIIAVVITIVTIIVVIHNQDNKVISRKFYIPLPQSTEVLSLKRFELMIEPFPYCEAAIRISENDYENFLSDMQSAGYSDHTQEVFETFKRMPEDWLPLENVKPITQVYQMNTAEYHFPFILARVHANIYITEPVDGFREIYMDRN